MKVFLRSGSLLLFTLILSCSAPYKHLHKTESSSTAYRFQPHFNKALYRCHVNGKVIFKKFHISGLLFFKQLENGTKRAVFQNEMGISFFDFEWDKNNSFKVNHMMEQMDKPAVIKTLQKDFEMLLMIGLDKDSEVFLTSDRGKEQFYRLNRDNGYVYYITEDSQLKRIENSGKRKKVVTINIGDKSTAISMPDSALFTHHKANFTISLNKIE